MSNPRYAGWISSGAAQPATSADSGPTWGDGAGFEAVSSTLATEDLIRIEVPAHCFIESVEVHMNTIAGAPTTLSLVAFRDAAGDSVFISDKPTGATQKIRTGLTTATQGGVSFLVGKDHHPLVFAGSSIDTNTADTGYTGNQTSALWFGFYTDVGGSTARIDRVIVNWRA